MSDPRAGTSPLATWFAGPSAVARFRAERLGQRPTVIAPRDHTWRTIAPGFEDALAMARGGLPFQIAADRRYDRSGDPRRLRGAVAAGKTVFLPQVHQFLPRLMRLMVALRVLILGPFREECSFLFIVEGTGRAGMGLHHDGEVDAFWLQLEGRRTATVGPPVPPGAPEELPDRWAAGGRRAGWRSVDLEPGTLFHLPPRTPHAVVCRGRSLALSLTWHRPRAGREAAVRSSAAGSRAVVASLVAWDVVSGHVDRVPSTSRHRLWTQRPAMVVPADGARRAGTLITCDGELSLAATALPLARRLAEMPSFARSATRTEPAFELLLHHGLVAPEDLPLRIIPERPNALDGWRFA